jgi:hypothetical protein
MLCVCFHLGKKRNTYYFKNRIGNVEGQTFSPPPEEFLSLASSSLGLSLRAPQDRQAGQEEAAPLASRLFYR